MRFPMFDVWKDIAPVFTYTKKQLLRLQFTKMVNFYADDTLVDFGGRLGGALVETETAWNAFYNSVYRIPLLWLWKIREADPWAPFNVTLRSKPYPGFGAPLEAYMKCGRTVLPLYKAAKVLQMPVDALRCLKQELVYDELVLAEAVKRFCRPRPLWRSYVMPSHRMTTKLVDTHAVVRYGTDYERRRLLSYFNKPRSATVKVIRYSAESTEGKKLLEEAADQSNKFDYNDLAREVAATEVQGLLAFEYPTKKVSTIAKQLLNRGLVRDVDFSLKTRKQGDIEVVLLVRLTDKVPVALTPAPRGPRGPRKAAPPAKSTNGKGAAAKQA